MRDALRLRPHPKIFPAVGPVFPVFVALAMDPAVSRSFAVDLDRSMARIHRVHVIPKSARGHAVGHAFTSVKLIF